MLGAKASSDPLPIYYIIGTSGTNWNEIRIKIDNFHLQSGLQSFHYKVKVYLMHWWRWQLAVAKHNYRSQHQNILQNKCCVFDIHILKWKGITTLVFTLHLAWAKLWNHLLYLWWRSSVLLLPARGIHHWYIPRCTRLASGSIAAAQADAECWTSRQDD